LHSKLLQHPETRHSMKCVFYLPLRRGRSKVVDSLKENA
jgi:hypothetical protein